MSEHLLTDRLLIQKSKFPKKPLFHWIDDSANITKRVTYDEFVNQAQGIAQYLLQNGIKSGDRVLLVYPPSLDFLIAFVGCLFAGVIAVPTFPPDPSKLNKDLEMFSSISSSSGADVALTSTSYNYATKIASLKSIFSIETIQWPELKWIVTDSIPSGCSITLPTITPNSIAFLQYTSGSTSDPKGVMITHSNLAHNLTLIITGLQAGNDTVVVSWLPQYHDMGLIGSYLGIIYCGGTGYYLSPLSFIRNPPLWIRAMSTYKATHIQAPNFAYSLTARKFLAFLSSRSNSNNMSKYSWIDELDLSSLRHMINAAEPVEASAMDIFYGVFGKYGLPNGVIYPTYGLAEHTVYVCSNGKQRIVVDKELLETDRIVKVLQSDSSEKGIIMVGCGKPSESDSVDLRIVNPESGDELSHDRVGEIWIKSKSRAMGYWNQPEKSKEDFEAVLTGTVDTDVITADGGYLRTGDLGFLHNQELFICGRSKDLIIIRGRNHYPQDIERTCETRFSHDLRGGCSAAFSAPFRGIEGLVYVAELNPNSIKSEGLNDLINHIRQAISKEHGITPEVIVLTHPKSIYKTTSGKIARQRIRRGYLQNELSIVTVWRNDSSITLQDDETLDSYVPMSPSIEMTDSSGPFDPTGQSLDHVIPHIQWAIAQCLASARGDFQSNDQGENLSVNVPLPALGLDSMAGVQLQGFLEKRFTIQLPDELMFEPDATITTLALALVQGGVLKHRPIMYNCWEVLQEAAKREKITKGKGKGILSSDWIRSNGIKAHVDTFKFKDGAAFQLAPLTMIEDLAYILNFIYIIFVSFGTPLILLILPFLLPIKLAVTIIAMVIAISYLWPDSYPIAFRTKFVYQIVMKYFSYRVIVESKIDPTIPTIYAMAPHGVFALPPIFLSVINEYINGQNFHTLGADVIFKIPGYNIICKLSALASVSRKVFKRFLDQGHNVAVVPGGIAEMFNAGNKNEEQIIVRKGFIRIALETGSQIIPCYTLGHSQTLKTTKNEFLEKLSRSWRVSIVPFWGRFGLPIPCRIPLVTILGRPIPCPKVSNPSTELVNQYHEVYLRELQRIYQRYKNVYNWHQPDRPLIINQSSKQ